MELNVRNNMEQIIKLELTVDEVNTILRSLGQHPFVQIADLIAKIKYQGDSQVAPAESTPEAANANANE